MPPTNLRKTVNQLSQNKRIEGTVVEVLRGEVSIRLGNGRLMKGLAYVGGPLYVTQPILVNWISGVPIVEAQGDTPITVQTGPTRVRSVLPDPEVLPGNGGLTATVLVTTPDGNIYLNFVNGLYTGFTPA